VVAAVFDRMMEAMERAGAVRLNDKEIAELTRHAIIQVGEGEHKHDAPAKEFLGKDASVLAAPGPGPFPTTWSCCSARPTNRIPSCPSNR